MSDLEALVREFVDEFMDTEIETMIEEGCDGNGLFAQMAAAVGVDYDPWREQGD